MGMGGNERGYPDIDVRPRLEDQHEIEIDYIAGIICVRV